MAHEDAAERIRKLIGEMVPARGKDLDAPKPSDDTTLLALDYDSLDCTTLVMALEDAFDIAIPDSVEITPDFTIARVIEAVVFLLPSVIAL